MKLLIFILSARLFLFERLDYFPICRKRQQNNNGNITSIFAYIPNIWLCGSSVSCFHMFHRKCISPLIASPITFVRLFLFGSAVFQVSLYFEMDAVYFLFSLYQHYMHNVKIYQQISTSCMKALTTDTYSCISTRKVTAEDGYKYYKYILPRYSSLKLDISRRNISPIYFL